MAVHNDQSGTEHIEISYLAGLGVQGRLFLLRRTKKNGVRFCRQPSNMVKTGDNSKRKFYTSSVKNAGRDGSVAGDHAVGDGNQRSKE